MPVRPEDIEKRISEEEAEITQRAFEEIDRALESRYVPGCEVAISLSMSKPRHAVQQKIIMAYENAGWEVDWSNYDGGQLHGWSVSVVLRPRVKSVVPADCPACGLPTGSASCQRWHP